MALGKEGETGDGQPGLQEHRADLGEEEREKSRAEKGHTKQHRNQEIRFLQEARSEERKLGEMEVDHHP